MLQPKSVRNPLKVIAMTQQKILPRLERLIQLLEETKALCQSTSTQRQQSSGIIFSSMPYFRNVYHAFVSAVETFLIKESRRLAETALLERGLNLCLL